MPAAAQDIDRVVDVAVGIDVAKRYRELHGKRSGQIPVCR
jgi:hypothetical protein